MLQVDFHGPETMEEKAAVFASLRKKDAISVSEFEHLSVHTLQSPRMHAELQILLLECMPCIMYDLLLRSPSMDTCWMLLVSMLAYMTASVSRADLLLIGPTMQPCHPTL